MKLSKNELAAMYGFLRYYAFADIRAKEKARNLKYRRQIRKQVLEVMGNMCCKCGFKDVRALEIDHVHGGGTKERRDGGHHTSLWRKIIKTKNFDNYQLLCANCHKIKRIDEHEFKPNSRAFQS